MTVDPPICMACKHYDKEGKKFSCTAFPDGIPMPIIRSAFIHNKPYPGDNGIQFEPIEGQVTKAIREKLDASDALG